MTSFSNKVLYTKGHLQHHSITITGTTSDTTKTISFREPIYNVISVEAVQGIIHSDNDATDDDWIRIKCPQVERRLEGKLGTGYDTGLAVVSAGTIFGVTHGARYFSKPKDNYSELTISLELVSSSDSNKTTLTLGKPWIIELELISIGVATHTDWKNIPNPADNPDDANNDRTHDYLHQPETMVVFSPKKKKKKATKNKESVKYPESSPSNSSLSRSSVVKGSLGALGVGTALAFGLKFK